MAKNLKKVANSWKIPLPILLTGRFLQTISPACAARFLALLFTAPRRHKAPRREHAMDKNSIQETLHLETLNKDIVVYQYGQSTQKVLLIHGWEGRGTQLVKIAEALLDLGFMTVSFDAPAHGKSPGKHSFMPEFITSIHEIDRKYGPFQAAIGHSLGGMSLFNALREGLKVDSAISIGAGDVVKDLFDDFTARMQLKPEISDRMLAFFEKRSPQTMDSFSAYRSAAVVALPILVVHDELDEDVPVSCARHIGKYLQNGKLLITNGLGHRKILGDPQVIEKITTFIKKGT